MRAALRVFFSLLLSGSIALAVVPAQTPVSPTKKTSCCAKAKTAKATEGCARQNPKSNEEKQCCAGCVFCLAILLPSPTPFVYPPMGEESFAAFIAGELNRPRRPQVPPPRLSLA
jgi:hypothetical protein